MLGPRPSWIARAVVVVVTLALAHDLTFLMRYGSAYGEALVHAGHGETWTNAVLVCLALGAALLIAAAWQLRRLGMAAHATTAGPLTAANVGAFARSWAGLAARLGLVVAVLLTVQENIERAARGLQAPDPAILASPQYPGALAIMAGVAIAVGLVVALFRWRRGVLLARIRAALAPRPRPLRPHRPPQRSDAVRSSILGRSLGVRAPPPGVVIRIAA
ncbi:MAG TPA: hypothetical protein VEX41_11020 [Candidatus Eisenbacteria bacterium]|nr:hypothetical protein [Candidatus Eisenbacteria bacterium]